MHTNAPGCVPVPQYTIPNLTLLACRYSSPPASHKENPKLRAAVEELRKAGVRVGDAVSGALKSMEESEVMRAVRIRTTFVNLVATAI